MADQPTSHCDRRTSDRFPIQREVRYRLLKGRTVLGSGGGMTVNMSSVGVLFASQGPLSIGNRLELSVSWPAKLNNQCLWKLVARGRVVRTEGLKAALEIEQYEFRTGARRPRASTST